MERARLLCPIDDISPVCSFCIAVLLKLAARLGAEGDDLLVAFIARKIQSLLIAPRRATEPGVINRQAGRMSRAESHERARQRFRDLPWRKAGISRTKYWLQRKGITETAYRKLRDEKNGFQAHKRSYAKRAAVKLKSKKCKGCGASLPVRHRTRCDQCRAELRRLRAVERYRNKSPSERSKWYSSLTANEKDKLKRDRSAARRLRRLKGLCICGREPEDGRARCQKCADRERAWKAMRRFGFRS